MNKTAPWPKLKSKYACTGRLDGEDKHWPLLVVRYADLIPLELVRRETIH